MSITKESENGMSLLKFNDYLEFTQNRVKENGEPPTRIVLGNESADLDSTVCCLLTSYALFLREKETPSHALCLPVLPIPRRTFLLRKDIINYFTSLDLTWESLLYFLEDLDAWHGNPLKVILVDTNILPRPVASLSTKWSIESIFDHHEDQQLHLTASPRQVVPVMSATSLVVNEYFPFFQTKSLCPTTFTLLAQLALAPLLMDTHDWRTCTHTDTDAYQLCLPYLPTRNGSLNHSSMYTQLRTWKTEGPWTLTEWIEKDMKWYSSTSLGSYVMASVPFSILSWFESEKTCTTLHAYFCDTLQPQGCVLLSILATHLLHPPSRSIVERHFYFHTHWGSLSHALARKCLDHSDVLQPHPLSTPSNHWHANCYRVKKENMSRKKFQPFFNTLLTLVSEELDMGGHEEVEVSQRKEDQSTLENKEKEKVDRKVDQPTKKTNSSPTF